jgi:hypothetical protein
MTAEQEFSGAKGLRSRVYIYDAAARVGTPDERHGGFYPDRELVGYLADRAAVRGDRSVERVLHAAGLH